MPVTFALILGVLAQAAAAPVQPPIAADELAAYRLTAATLERFQQASRLIAAVTRDDPRFASAPLFTEEIAVSGDAAEMAGALDARLRSEPGLAHALETARMTSREYTRFALALIAARLAHGFVKAGVLRRVPAGVAADNVAFVDARQMEIAAILRELGIDPPA